jgi:lipoprotein-anchoring transpeptidase ErfK/SrfK
MLTSPLSLRAYDPVTNEAVTWAVAPEVWSAWLSLDVDPADMDNFTWTVDEEQTRTYLETQATTLGAGRYVDTSAAVTGVTTAVNSQNLDVRLRVYHHERQHAVQPGETIASIGQAYGMPYPWIQQANPGVGDSLGVGQTLTIPSPDVLLPLPVVENKRIVVSISQQRMWAYENGALKWEWPVSTGIASSPTSPGVFQIQSHEPNAYAGNWDLWMPNFMGIYRPVPTSDFMNGFHGFPTRGNSQLLWTGDLGHKVTYGCILISSDNAQLLYEWAEEGVVVEVQA